MKNTEDSPYKETQPVREAWHLGLTVAVLYTFAAVLDLNEAWIDFAEKYEHLELDELPIGLALASISVAFYAFRRLRESRSLNRSLLQTQQELKNIQLELRQNLEKEVLRAEAISQLRIMTDFFLAGRSLTEFAQITQRFLAKIVPREAISIYLLDHENNKLRLLNGWNDSPEKASNCDGVGADSCWVLKRDQMYLDEDSKGEMLCFSASQSGANTIACFPVRFQDKCFGIIQLRRCADTRMDMASSELNELLLSVANTLAININNLYLQEKTREESLRDPLTGLLNRRGLEAAVNREVQRAKKTNGAISLAMIDIDYFKSFNDKFGHDKGDRAITSVCSVIMEVVRSVDIVSRYGGEEFLVVFSGMSLEQAFRKLEEIRISVEQKLSRLVDTGDRSFSISAGVAAFDYERDSFREAVCFADEALYLAKSHGRNQVQRYAPATE